MAHATITISDGFRADHRATAAALFWQAFRDKLAPVMKPEQRALAYLEAVVDPEHAISAVSSDGRLLGIAGYKTDEGAFIGAGLGAFQRAYGMVGGTWRGLLLSLLERKVEPGVLLMDGIFVTEAARGQGIGTALLMAIRDKAAALGCSRVRLDVIDTNARARALYERSGFVAGATTQLGPLRHVFGFRSSTTMVLRLV